MKSKHRHELRTNELADAIGRAIEWSRPRRRAIGYGALAVLVLVVILVVLPAIRGSAAGRNPSAEAFQEARLSGQVQPLRNFLVDFPKAEQAPAARLLLADRLLAEVVRGPTVLAGEDPQARAAKLLAEAKENYEQAARSSPVLEPLARAGLALVTVQEGDLEKGRAALQEVIARWPHSLGAEKARSSLETLAGYVPLEFSNEPLEEPRSPEQVPPAPAPAAPQPSATQPTASQAGSPPALPQPGATQPATARPGGSQPAAP